PLIGITSCTHRKGVEFEDVSLSLSLRYTRIIAESGGIPLVIPNAPKFDPALLERIDGLLLSGGGDVEPALYDKDNKKRHSLAKSIDRESPGLEAGFILKAFEKRKPLLAICRGMQILNVALGGTLYIDLPSEVGNSVNHRVSNMPESGVHLIRIDRKSRLFELTGLETVDVNSTHHQAIREPAKELSVTASAEDGVAEAMECARHPFLIGVQFHPERLSINGKNPFGKLFTEFVKQT
ncbi:MAG: gamma-glutamyl-gamma-aminobutyrate hydrolase family protein, partial [Deltaproteobacteria bacterium]|nr:gamma-glutamyl-gamma-aminobutyrate hydrolase family protein [Deltaproteobacteria bacterium]